MKFNSDKFSFNNIHCSTKNVSLLWGDDAFIEYGLNIDKPIEYDGLNWKAIKDNRPETVKLHIIYEINDVAQVWTKEKIRDIESWLVTDEFAPFISDDDKNVTYYFKVVNIVRKFDSRMLGWLEVEFQPIANSGFVNKRVVLKDAARFMKMRNIPALTIVNESDFNYKNYPILKISNLVGEVTFNNLTTGKALTVKGHGKVTVDNKMKTIFDEEGNNLLSQSNREWLYLNKGVNKIQVIGDCSVELIAQYEVKM